MSEEGFAIPPVFQLAASTTLSRRITQILYAWAADNEIHQPKRDIEDIINISEKLHLHLKDDPAGRLVAGILEQRLTDLTQEFILPNAKGVENLLSLSAKLPVDVDFMEAQNLFFHLMEEHWTRLASGHRVQPDAKTLADVLLSIAVQLNFNPGRYEELLERG
jgi:hypothetical protein